MSNRRKTKEQRLRQTVRSREGVETHRAHRETRDAQEQLSRIDLLKQYAALQGHTVKES